MDRLEFVIRMTEIILADWRKVMLANPKSADRFNLPGDVCDISWRAMQKAEEIANHFEGSFK
jgi:hypothetical protein